METNPNQLKEILGELFSLLEAMETSNLAVLQFLKEKGIANEKEFAHFLEQAGNASSVKWRAARVRMEYLLTPIKKETWEEKHEVKEASPKKEKETAAKESPKEQKPDNEKAEKLVTDLGAAGIEKAEPKKDSGIKGPKDEQSRTEPARTEDKEKNPKKPENK
jgi:hypothetical protein